MKLATPIVLLLIAVLAGCNAPGQAVTSERVARVSQEESVQAPPDRGSPGQIALVKEAQLTRSQIQLLKALGLRIATPSYIPPGFRLEVVQAELAHSLPSGQATYKLIYQKYDVNSGKTLCFAIEATNGGIGGLPPGKKSYPVNSPALGESTLEYGLYGDAANPTLLGNWLGTEQGPFYRFVGANLASALSRCNNISPQEAVRVFESLQYLP